MSRKEYIEELESRINDLEYELEISRNQNEEQELDISSLIDTIWDLRVDMQTLRDRVESKCDVIFDLETENENLSTQVDDLEYENNNLTNENACLEEEVQQLSEET